MSFLAPLYLLGAAAIAAPIVFHLIRRQPKGEIEFSSLMFLEPTPPRLTRRSRLENLPLLLLRCLAIFALAFAFARPFLPSVASKSEVADRKAVVLLVDRSASMQREGAWDRLVSKAKEIVNEADEGQLISVVSFDETPKTELSLAESLELSAGDRRGAVLGILENMRPGWKTSDIGLGLRYAADQSSALVAPSELETETDEPMGGATVETRISLLSDLQDGAAIQSLQGYEWPDQVWLDLQSVQPKSSGNASLRVVGSHADVAEAEVARRAFVRVEVGHFEDAGNTTFRLRFGGAEDDAGVVQVPAGESRFVTVDLPESVQSARTQGARLTLYGDGEPFDNTCFFVPPKRSTQRVLIVGEDQDTGRSQRERLSFYLSQLPFSNPTRDVSVERSDASVLAGCSPAETPLIVVANAPQPEWVEPLQKYLRRGGRVITVLDKPVEDPASLATLLDSPQLRIDEGGNDREYALVSSVDFRDQLVAPLSEPGFSDFSNIRVWKHRALSGLGESLQTILKLDDSAPLLVERKFRGEEPSMPDGHLWVLTSGWQPDESQLALSTKFVPLMLGMLGGEIRSGGAKLKVGDSVGKTITTEPGIENDESGDPVAVNLAWDESETSPLDVDRLKQFGARLSSAESKRQEELVERALRDVELESRQAWWQWLIVATLGVVALETVYSGRHSWNSETTQG
ncbi:MAG: BatA and WFA domain-containing protein [Planctomycetota bacterium]